MINNTVYEKKHYYALILKNIGILKNKIDEDVLNNELSKARSYEIVDLYNRTLLQFIEEGASFQLIKDATNSSNDKVQVIIDGVTYYCLTSDAKIILGPRYKDVLKEEYSGLSQDELNEAKTKKQPSLDNTNVQLLEETKSVLNEIRDSQKQQSTQTSSQTQPKTMQQYRQSREEERYRLEQARKKKKKAKNTVKTIITLLIILFLGFLIKTTPSLNQAFKNTSYELKKVLLTDEESKQEIDENADANIADEINSNTGN